ncbi:expansin-A30 [Canna indica]|uniref:Expansin-A30 n=1 Tax=Canna indica TaxID=4628 RepID=A0AAQ3KAY2_9LILI|nr:expansin-A30 [Canna indica]
MASSSSSLSRCSIGFLIIATAMLRAGAVFPATPWSTAHATFYGDESASATMGLWGLWIWRFVQRRIRDENCSAELGVVQGWIRLRELLSDPVQWRAACYRGSPIITVTATNLCPPNWAQPSDNGGWCNPPRVHFDLSKPAFMNMADWHAGIVPVMYRRVPCPVRGGIRFRLQGNSYWLLAFVMNVGGGGDVASMWVKGSSTGWISMSHNWGVSYQAFSRLGGQPLSFKVMSYTTRQTIVAYNVAPSNWNTGLTYEATVNFH